MPVFLEDPAQLSKSRLKSHLIAHNVALPPVDSRKEVYVEMYVKHIDPKNVADFSSDEEDQAQDVAETHKEEDPAEMLDPSGLTDDELKATLLKHGVKAGPIVASTRALYEKKLKQLQTDAQHRQNGTGEGALYSDSDDEDEEEKGEEEEESSSEQARQETVSQLEQAQQECSEVPLEPVTDILKEMFPDTVPTPTGIYATCRRPIKGAAGRPLQFKYPDAPLSPMTLERREVERRLVPVQIQILVFLIVAFLLYLIYVCVEDNSYYPFVALLDSLYQLSASEEGLLLQAETQDTPVLAPLSGQE